MLFRASSEPQPLPAQAPVARRQSLARKLRRMPRAEKAEAARNTGAILVPWPANADQKLQQSISLPPMTGNTNSH